jgi:D-alanyl-D-alanine carboxypeptidase
MRRILLLDSLLIIALVAGYLLITHKPPSKITGPAKKPLSSSFDKNAHSTDEAGSVWVVVNKGRLLPANFAPADLINPNMVLAQAKTSENMKTKSETAQALERLTDGAAAAGIKLELISGYRSFSSQKTLYSSYSASDGPAAADRYSARPGHSEHQTGLAADLGAVNHACDLEECFGATPEGRWLAANSYKYGFIIRYPKDKESLTGYQYEPWHIRYVGTSLADQLNKTGQTMEQFFGLPSFTSYPSTFFQLR